MPQLPPQANSRPSGQAPATGESGVSERPQAVGQMLALLDWADTGRPLTSTGHVRLADARELVELLATGDEWDPKIGKMRTKTRSSAELDGLQRLLEWAHLIDLLQTERARLRPGPAAARLRENPEALRKVLFSTVLRLPETRRGWQWVRTHLDGAPDLSAGLVALWRQLRTAPLTSEEAVATVWDALTRPYQLEAHQPPDLPYWKRAVGKDVALCLALYQAVGAVSTSPAGQVHLTAYGFDRQLPVVRDHTFNPRDLGEAFIREETSAQTCHPDDTTVTELAPAVWTLAHRGYSGSGRLDVWVYPSRKTALKAGADLAMACGMDEEAEAQSLYLAGKYQDLLAMYERHHPDTHVLRVQPSFLHHEP
ncbi:hypothetical protein ACH4U6_36410 [Streptomyces netropsis]|uniref:hypothetical protein n=1 Tax=Streptomyces netropsis TaxID=55404 RepID=UPI003788F18E